MRLNDLAGGLQLPIDDLVRMGQQQAADPHSKIYAGIRDEFAKKLAAQQATAVVDKKKGKHRVYISHVVPSTFRYELTRTFPHWDFRFVGNTLVSAPGARAVYECAIEYLFQKVAATRGNVIAYGTGLPSIVMRARRWAHLCIPGHEMHTQHEFLKQDRSVVAMVNAVIKRGRHPGLAKEYVSGEVSVHCTTPVKCTHKANAAIMMLHNTDCSFRQIAVYMKQHAVRLLYFAIPVNKNLEFGTAGKFPELDAYVNPTENGNRIDIIYKNDTNLTQSYTYTNYLELVAMGEYDYGGYTYKKEIDNVFLGVAVYKVTCFPTLRDENGIRKDTPSIYRSWIDPKYKDHYMVYAPVIVHDGTVSRPEHYSYEVFPVDRGLFDDVHDAAMRADGVNDLAGFIRRRLNSKISHVVAMHQVVQRNKMLAVTRFDMVAFVIYCSVFMKKFTAGKAVSTLAPEARDIAHLGRSSAVSLFSTYAKTLFGIATESTAPYLASIRKYYYALAENDKLPLPMYMLEPGYVEYSDNSSGNPRFRGWDAHYGDPTYGFYHGLPGAEFVNVLPYRQQFGVPKLEDDEYASTTDFEMIATGQAFVGSQANFVVGGENRLLKRDVMLFEASEDVTDIVGSVGKVVLSFLYGKREQVVPTSPVRTDFDVLYSPVVHPRVPQLITEVPVKPRTSNSDTTDSQKLVQKILNDNRNLVNMVPELFAQKYFDSNDTYERIPGQTSDNPLVDIQDAIKQIFPNSLLMNTQFFESDKFYGDSEFNLSGNKIKIDLSRMKALKPERFYLPILRGHVQPNLQKTQGNVLQAFQKRNFNTPDLTDPMDEDKMVHNAWNAYVKVFLKPDSEKILDALPYVGPDVQAVRDWVSRLPEQKRNKLLGQEDFGVEDLDLMNNTMMLKQKLKPNLGGSYETSLKAGQTIQFDGTGKVVATISPVIGKKVDLEASMLKPNVFIAQRKSIADMIAFLNQFDWREDERGPRWYLEGDYETFDKTQGIQAAKLHWYKCQRFGVLPELSKFLREHNMTRSVSAIEVGIKAFLDVQRGSGHPDTLDGNNDVNEMVLAELLLSVLPHVEFIMIQGDDFIVALRGVTIQVATWEFEIKRKYNLTIKLALHTHGYICSYDIVHLPDGHTVLVADIVKRTLSFMTHDKKDEQLFPELFKSYVDAMQHIDDIRVQNYLSQALPKRMQAYLPGTTPESIKLLCRAHTALKHDLEKFRNMFSDTLTTRYY